MNTPEDRFAPRGTPRKPEALLRVLESEAFLRFLAERIYGDREPTWLRRQQTRYIETVRRHEQAFGEEPLLLLRAPGRLNLFIEYLDICRGDHMSTTTDDDIPMAFSQAARGSDRVRAVNADPLFADGSFSIQEELDRFRGAAAEPGAAAWEARTRVHPHHGRRRGDWLNYLLAPFLRMGFDGAGEALSGCDLTIGPSTIPIRAGTSSSSALVVLATHALWLANQDRLPLMSPRQVCRFMGESEWYVGTRGGANDQTTIFRNARDGLLYNLHHLDLIDSRPLPWLKGIEVILCNSLWEADKALGARYVFNMRKGWTDLGRDLLLAIIDKANEHLRRTSSPEAGWVGEICRAVLPDFPAPRAPLLERRPDAWRRLGERFIHLGSLDERLLELPAEIIDEFIHLLPSFITPREAGRALGKDEAALERDYTLPGAEDGGYQPRQAATFFFVENGIGRSLEALLLEADEKLRSGALRPDAPAYHAYRVKIANHIAEVQDALRHVFQVSNNQLERLLDVAASGPGYLAGKLTGAGSGGCVCVLVGEGNAQAMMEWLDSQYFGKKKNFTEYREVLKKLSSSRDGAERAKGVEMEMNLERALALPQEQRRVVTFSQGAGVVDV